MGEGRREDNGRKGEGWGGKVMEGEGQWEGGRGGSERESGRERRKREGGREGGKRDQDTLL